MVIWLYVWSKMTDVSLAGTMVNRCFFGWCDGKLMVNWVQRFKIKNTRSPWKYVTQGVPQGSILGPLLFNIFMNDMFFFIDHCTLYNYADDNSMSASSENIQRVLSLLQKKAVQWFTSNGMQANPQKFHCMLLSSCNIDVGNMCLYVGDTLLSPEPCVKVLGVTIDRCLTFSNHVSNLCQKAAKELHALARISRYPDEKSRIILYITVLLKVTLIFAHLCGISVGK